GFFGEATLPKEMVLIGMVVGVIILIIDEVLRRRNSSVRLHVMPVAVGIYLPFGLAVPIVLGGVIRTLVDRRDQTETGEHTHRGVLMTSGLIAGESLIGVALGFIAWLGVSTLNGIGLISDILNLSDSGEELLGQLLSVGALTAVALWVWRTASRRTAMADE
ncbi:MAG: OPT/YSL family transporter, partial [Fuerstiella sp.]